MGDTTHGVALQPDVFLVLLFPDGSEFRWVSEPPRPGSGIRSSRGQSWRVEEVLQSGVRTYTVYCGAPRHGLAGARDLAADLLGRARKTVSSEKRTRRRFIP